MSALLLKQKRRVAHIRGDGNCFFRALSLFLYNTQEQHHKVRMDIAKFEAENEHQFAALLIDPTGRQTIGQHIESINKPRVWASQIELQAAAEFYRIPLYLYSPTPDKRGYHWLCYQPRTSSPTVTRSHIELAHPASIHFDLIVDAATMTPSQIPPQMSDNAVDSAAQELD